MGDVAETPDCTKTHPVQCHRGGTWWAMLAMLPQAMLAVGGALAACARGSVRRGRFGDPWSYFQVLPSWV